LAGIAETSESDNQIGLLSRHQPGNNRLTLHI